MNETSSVRKPSGLKPPTKIVKPISIVLDKISNQVDASPLPEDTDSFILGDRVFVGGIKPGVIAFIGETHFGPGDWAGVVLDDPVGKNDGAVAGVRYFQCASNRGIFTRLSRLSRNATNSDQSSLQSMPVTPEHKRTLSSISFASSVASSSGLKTPTAAGYSNHFSDNCGGKEGSPNIKKGDRVIVQSSQGSKVGVLRYYGTTQFGNGIWCGIELDDPVGKNDGAVGDVRYFQCAPKFGLFVPAEKVSLSPASTRRLPQRIVHPGAMRRQGTSDSMRSTSTVQTSATLDMKTNRRSTARLAATAENTSNHLAASVLNSSLQEQLQEKETYIKQLLKERDLERAQITTAATQAEQAEKDLEALNNKYEQMLLSNEIQHTNLLQTIDRLKKKKHDLSQQLDEAKKKMEDLQFSYEEESINKSEIQALNNEYVEKLKTLDMVVNSQHTSLDEQSYNISTGESSKEKESTIDENNAELVDAKKMVVLLTEQNSKLEYNYQQLHEDLEVLKLIDRGKEEVISSLQKEIASYQQSDINGKEELEMLKIELIGLKEEYDSLKTKWSNTDEEFNTMETNLCHKDAELNKLKAAVNSREETAEEEKKARTDIERINNDLQFELEENRTKIEEISCQVENMGLQISTKEKEYGALTQYITNLGDQIDQFNIAANRMLLANEETPNNIDQVLTETTNLHTNQSSIASLIDHCPQQLKDKLVLLHERTEEFNNSNVILLKKLQTLSEVIFKKDVLLEETLAEKEIIQTELQESLTQKVNQLKILENNYADLNKAKETVERHLKASKESVTELESSSVDKDTVKSQLERVRKELGAKISEYRLLLDEFSLIKEKLDLQQRLSKEQLEVFEKEKEEFKTYITSFDEKLASAIEEKCALQKDYLELRTMVNNLEAEDESASQDTRDNLSHHEVLEIYRHKFTNLKETMCQLGQENVAKKQKLVEMGNACERYEDEMEQLKKDRDRLQEELREATVALNSLQEKLSINAIREAQVQDLQNQHQCLKESIHAVECEKNNLQNKLGVALAENTRMESQLSILKEEKSMLDEQLNGFTSTNHSLSQQVVEKDNKISELCRNLQVLENAHHSNSTLQQELTTVRQTNGNLERSIKSLKAELDTRKELTKKLKEELHIERTESDREIQTFQSNMENKVIGDINELKTAGEQHPQGIFDGASTVTYDKGGGGDQLFGKLLMTDSLIMSKDLLNNNDDNFNNSNDLISTDTRMTEKVVDNQIDFLNSVIVDMQGKNETLLERVKYLENIIPADLLKPVKKMVAPRLFCDICDVFDLHETEDCPKQCSSSPPPGRRRSSPKTKPASRPYCEICEVFGHDRSECNDEETF